MSVDSRASSIAGAISVPARTRMMYCLSDGRARTSTELAIVGGVTPSTASVHLKRLEALGLVKVYAQSKHRYYSLNGPEVADALEALSVLAGSQRFAPKTPDHLRLARSCYDHMAGVLGVSLHDRLIEMRWIAGEDDAYELTAKGSEALRAVGLDVEEMRGLRRRLAFGCLDWSERRPHLAGALGAGLLCTALKRRWVVRDLDSRALRLTAMGKREMVRRFGIRV